MKRALMLIVLLAFAAGVCLGRWVLLRRAAPAAETRPRVVKPIFAQ